EFNVQGQPRSLPPEWEENILRICQEVLTNALRHAHASQFKAQLLFVPSAVRLDLCDNGCGFDPAGKHDGSGLTGMRERVEGMGGKITNQSATGKGTAILIVLPLATDSIEPRMNADKHGCIRRSHTEIERRSATCSNLACNRSYRQTRRIL